MSPKEPRPLIKSVVLESPGGLRVTVLNLGALIQSIEVPAVQGPVNVVLGFEDHDDYVSDANYMGATVGRFANRIRDAEFSLDGVTHGLDANERTTGHCLHGGTRGFHKQVWTLTAAADSQSVECRYLSPDGEGGFPGNLQVSVNYQLLNQHTLVVDYRASTDRDSVVSLANHAYFNLDRNESTIDTHHISIAADAYTPTDKTKIPTGEMRHVAATPFDLRQLTPLRHTDTPLSFDNYFVLPDPDGTTTRRAAELYSPQTGIRLRLHTTQPGLQLYTGEGLVSPFRVRQGLCLETQAFPNAPNQVNFPVARLAAGGLYCHRTIYEFQFEAPCL